MNAQITIELEAYEQKKQKIASLEKTVTELQAALDEARLGDAKDDRRRLAEALCVALEVVAFATAERSPLAFRGWPYAALRRLGELLAECPGVPRDFRECAKGSWEIFAREAEKWEKARAEGKEQEVLAEENLARGIPPDHPIFDEAVTD